LKKVDGWKGDFQRVNKRRRKGLFLTKNEPRGNGTRPHAPRRRLVDEIQIGKTKRNDVKR